MYFKKPKIVLSSWKLVLFIYEVFPCFAAALVSALHLISSKISEITDANSSIMIFSQMF